MTLILISLLACLDASSDPNTVADPTDAGGVETELPSWSGTQIGEEGDIFCEYAEGEWDKAAQAASPWDPSALPAGSWAGTFSAELPREEAALAVSIAPDGAPAALLPLVKEKDCPVGVLQPITLTFSAPPLLDVVVSGELAATELLVLRAEVDEGELDGALSPGRLPDDAGALLLEISGAPEDGWSGGARWILERPSGPEESSAGVWDAQ